MDVNSCVHSPSNRFWNTNPKDRVDIPSTRQSSEAEGGGVANVANATPPNVFDGVWVVGRKDCDIDFWFLAMSPILVALSVVVGHVDGAAKVRFGGQRLHLSFGCEGRL